MNEMVSALLNKLSSYLFTEIFTIMRQHFTVLPNWDDKNTYIIKGKKIVQWHEKLCLTVKLKVSSRQQK